MGRRRNPFTADAAYTAALSKALRLQKKKLGLSSIAQGYKGTGSKAAARQLWLRRGDGDLVDLWLDQTGMRLGGVIKAPATIQGFPTHYGYTGNVEKDASEIINIVSLWSVGKTYFTLPSKGVAPSTSKKAPAKPKKEAPVAAPQKKTATPVGTPLHDKTPSSYVVTLRKDGKVVGQLGPYAQHRAAAIDAKTMLINAGIPTSAIVEKGKMKVWATRSARTDWQDYKARKAKMKAAGKRGSALPAPVRETAYVFRPAGYVGNKGAVTFSAMITKAGKLPTKQFSNPRRSNGSKKSVWKKSHDGVRRRETSKGTLEVWWTPSGGGGFIPSTPSEDGPICKTADAAMAWADKAIRKRSNGKRGRKNPNAAYAKVMQHKGKRYEVVHQKMSGFEATNAQARMKEWGADVIAVQQPNGEWWVYEAAARDNGSKDRRKTRRRRNFADSQRVYRGRFR